MQKYERKKKEEGEKKGRNAPRMKERKIEKKKLRRGKRQP